jgi:hypothetical protein
LPGIFSQIVCGKHILLAKQQLSSTVVAPFSAFEKWHARWWRRELGTLRIVNTSKRQQKEHAKIGSQLHHLAVRLFGASGRPGTWAKS